MRIWHISVDDIRSNDYVASRKDKYKHETLLYGNQQGNSQKKRRSYDTKDNPTKKVKNEDNGDDSGGDSNGTSIPKTKRERVINIVVKKEETTSTDLVVRTENTSIVKVKGTCGGTMTVVDEMDQEEANTKWKEKSSNVAASLPPSTTYPRISIMLYHSNLSPYFILW